MMRWSLFLGRISGIRISIHWTFLLLIGWVLLSNFSQGNPLSQGLMTVLFILAVFFCVTLHELGHALTAKRYNIRTKSITLLPIGGLANMERMPKNPAHELKVAIAGPMVNVVIAALLYLFIRYNGGFPSEEELKGITGITGGLFFFHLFVVNILLAVFNMIPAFPMDGGRVLRALLSMKYSRKQATRSAAQIGQFLAILFVFFGLFYNFWMVFIGIFIFLGANAENIYESTSSVLEKYTVKDVLMKDYVTLHPYDTLQKAVDHLLDSQDQEFLIMEGNVVQGVLTRNEILQGLAQHGKEGAVMRAMRKDFLRLETTMNLQEVYQKMMSDGSSVHPVFENEELVGIIDKENIHELLMINEVLPKEEGTSESPQAVG